MEIERIECISPISKALIVPQKLCEFRTYLSFSNKEKDTPGLLYPLVYPEGVAAVSVFPRIQFHHKRELKRKFLFFFSSGASEYDFIIIGAGSAGAVIANRLTEIDEWKILLLEAGGDESFLGQVPAMAADLQRTEQDWQFKTEVLSGQACLGMENQR